MMTIGEARRIGQEKLGLRPELFNKAHKAAQQMDVLPQHLGPMTLALALLGVAKATDKKEMAGELTDALSLVSKAEKEWRMEQLAGKGRA